MPPQAEIYMAVGEMRDGHQRTMCVRGPCRAQREQAYFFYYHYDYDYGHGYDYDYDYVYYYYYY